MMSRCIAVMIMARDRDVTNAVKIFWHYVIGRYRLRACL